MKIIFESKPTVKFKEIKVGQVFTKSAENRIYMKTNYIKEENCVDLESGMMRAAQPFDDVVLIDATLVLK